MRFLEFLSEGEASSENAILKMESQCQPFLKELGSRQNVLWRGFNRRFVLADNHIVPVAQNRKPLDTDRAMHDAMDDWFFDNFGFRARSNAVFGSGSKSHSGTYGKVLAIYPIGKYEYVWSPRVSDTFLLNDEARKILRKIENDSGTKFRDDEFEDEKASIVIDIMDKSRYIDSDLKAALNSGNEIMVHCEKYYAFAQDDALWQEWASGKDPK